MGDLILPGLVNFFGMKRDVRDGLRAAMRQCLEGIPAQPHEHAKLLADGRFAWRAFIAKNLGIFFNNSRGACDDMADVIFRGLEIQWRAKHPGWTPQDWLDHVEEVKDTPTEAEIEDAWEVEIGSSERAMRQTWEGSARTRSGKDLGQRAVPLKPEEME